MSDTAVDDTRDDAAGQGADDAARDQGQGSGNDDDAAGRGDDDTRDDDRSPEALARARREARSLRQRLRTAETELEQHRKANETETQRLDRELKASQARIEQAETRARELEVQVAASRLGVRPDATDVVAGLVDWDEVDRDDPKAVERAIRDVVKARPYLSAREGSGGLDGGKGRGAGAEGGTDMNAHIRRLAGRG